MADALQVEMELARMERDVISEIGHLDFDPSCFACEQKADYIAAWRECDHYGASRLCCTPCQVALRRCPSCGASGYMSIVESL